MEKERDHEEKKAKAAAEVRVERVWKGCGEGVEGCGEGVERVWRGCRGV
jgi:hypothetical protein